MIYTIGHSTRLFEEFLALLHERDVRVLADVRTVPRSRRVPQFNRETLRQALLAAGIAYLAIIYLSASTNRARFARDESNPAS